MFLRKKTMFFVAGAVLCLSVGVATATAGGGNSDNAKLCQQGGWKSLFASDGRAFTNQGDCVSYGAKGGTIATTQSASCDGVTCRYTDPGNDTSVTAPQGRLSSVTFSAPNVPLNCTGSQGTTSVGAIVTYVPNQDSGSTPFQITFRYNADEVQNYVNAHDEFPKMCFQKSTDSGFSVIPQCPIEGVATTPCVASQGYEFAPIDTAQIPVDYQVTVLVSPDDPRAGLD